MRQGILKRESNALADALAYDKEQAKQRFANLMATLNARREGLEFDYWPKHANALRYMI